eukprot:4891039-Pyramimonas_sp.AAC.2
MALSDTIEGTRDNSKTINSTDNKYARLGKVVPTGSCSRQPSSMSHPVAATGTDNAGGGYYCGEGGPRRQSALERLLEEEDAKKIAQLPIISISANKFPTSVGGDDDDDDDHLASLL